MSRKKGNNSERKGIKGEPPPILRYLVWIRQNWRYHWRWIIFVGVATVILKSGIVNVLINGSKTKELANSKNETNKKVPSGTETKEMYTDESKENSEIVSFPQGTPEKLVVPKEVSLDMNKTVFQLNKEQLLALTDRERIEVINKCYLERDALYLLDVIKTIQKVEDHDEQLIRFIDKLIKEKNLSMASIFIDQLKLGHNKDKKKSELIQASRKL